MEGAIRSAQSAPTRALARKTAEMGHVSQRCSRLPPQQVPHHVPGGVLVDPMPPRGTVEPRETTQPLAAVGEDAHPRPPAGRDDLCLTHARTRKTRGPPRASGNAPAARRRSPLGPAALSRQTAILIPLILTAPPALSNIWLYI